MKQWGEDLQVPHLEVARTPLDVFETLWEEQGAKTSYRDLGHAHLIKSCVEQCLDGSPVLFLL